MKIGAQGIENIFITSIICNMVLGEKKILKKHI